MSDVSERIGALSPGERAALAMRLARAARADKSAAESAITRRRNAGPAPLSFAQKGLWFLSQMEADNVTYNLPVSYELLGRLDVPTLERGLNEIVRRHEALRTTFTILDGEPVQVITPTLTLGLPVVDLTDLRGDEQWEELRRRANEYVRQPFDLERGPLVRATLLKLSDETHYLLVLMHHIVGDAWSMGIIMSELSALYRAFLAGEPSPLAELPIQYADFAIWQRERLAADALQRQLDYWKQKLGGAASVLQLPTDHPRPSVPTHRGSSQFLLLPEEVSRAVKELSQREGVTLFMTLLAAFDVLLYRYTGQTDISVGSPLAGRSRPEAETLIGLFLNPVVLRTDLSGNPSLRQLLGCVREVMLEAHANQDVPFEKLVAELQPERAVGHTPLFQVMFILQNAPMDESVASGDLVISLSKLDADIGAAKFDLTLSLEETTDGRLLSYWDYKTDLFEHATITRMFGHLRKLLENVVADPDRRLSEIGILDEDERRHLLNETNATAAPFKGDACAHELFELQAARTPEATALVFADKRVSYGELNTRANRLARHLLRRGVTAGHVVGLHLERSIEMIVGVLAVLKAGGAYVPLDPAYPAGRIQFMLENSEARLLLTERRLAGSLPALRDGVFYLDAEQQAIEDESGENLTPAAATPTDLAYIIYTSGSTGQPKGVMIEHRSLCNFAEALSRVFDIRPESRVLQFAPFSFDASVFEVFTTLTVGATLVLAPQTSLLPGPSLIELLREQSITAVLLPPAALAAMPDAALEALRTLIVGGDECPPEVARRWAAGRRFINAYGPTETTICATVAVCDAFAERLPVGLPIQNTEVYLLDDDAQPVPVIVPGELHIGGVGLARGYINRPDLTAEKFVPHPFSREPGARLYKTGDLARFRPDGQIEVLGRRDRQAKVRGFRIEPGEIEAALVAHPDVREAAVITHEESPSQKRLVAYTVAAAGERAPDADALRSHLKTRLPAYMLPSAFVSLDALPLTPSGKVDRQRLPAPGGVRPELVQGYVAPRTELEKMLAEMWQTVLRVSEVGVNDNFFDLGGDSIHAAIFINSLQERLDVLVYVVALFHAPTVAALAAHLEERHASTLTARTELTPIRPLDRDGGQQFPLSFAQQRLWFIDRLTLDSAFYNIPQALRLNGRLDVPTLERSLNEILRRHEALRTSFTDSGGRPVQVVHDLTTLSLPLTELSRLPAGVREREALRLAVEEGHRPFDLSIAPLMRAGLLRLSDHEHILLVTMHHIVSDGWSAGIFLRELAALYDAFLKGEPSPLSELPVQYADFAVWQREWLQGEVLEEQLDYWKQRLGGELPVLNLPTDRPRPPALSYKGAEQALELPVELTERLKSLSRHEGATLFMMLLAAFDALLYRYTGQDDIVVGTPIAGRNRREVEGLIGFFVNTLVMRTGVEGTATFRELLGHVREATLGAYAHQEVPFEKLVEELHPKRDTSRNPLFQVMLALQNTPLEDFRLPGLRLVPFDISNDMMRFDLEFHLWEHEATLAGTLIYNTDLFDAATVAQMLGHFRNLLEGVAASPDARVSELPLLTEAEHRRLLYEWNDTRRVYPHETCVHELFEAQATRTPDATAVVSDEGRITYRELNERANRLARHLRRRGVGRENLVGVCLGRGAKLVEALLGVLKAGGAYVPLDPEYPKPRLRFMLEDAGVRVLLTERQKLDALPSSGAEIICLDDDAEIDGENMENLRHETAADNLAYIIYTSGSTGKPKGVCITHQALNRLVCETNYVQLTASDRVAQVSTASFDAATFEIWGALLHGAQLHVMSREVVISPQEFAEQIREQGITTMFLTTALFNQLARVRPDALAPLSHLLFGGEAVDPERVREVLLKGAPRRLLHVYGPTENTTFSSWHHVVEVSKGAHTVPIGRPVTNTQSYVLDSDLRPVPIGVAGELFLGGAGLMRGYLNRPEVTAEKLVPHPYSVEVGARLYRTGDLVRLLHDGSIEFLERIDRQVKVRGFRIELGEIESALVEHSAVSECVVLAREEQPGERRLVAYVVNRAEDAAPAEEESGVGLRSGQVEHWQKIFDDHIYSKPSTQPDPTFNIVGWNSNYTDEPLPADEMRVWLEDTLEPVRATAPRRVLEIGCGTGLLLSRLAPTCERYLGTDVSQVALDYVSQQVRQWGEGQSRVSLLRRAADDFEGIEPRNFDAVILNSVVQYFPDADYLLRVLEGAARAVRPGGFIYVGDVRSLPLLETFHTSVQLFKAPPSLLSARLREQARTRAAQENELAVAPAFFYALAKHLPEVARVEVRPKRGHFHNELTRFRYQVLIHIGGETEPAADAAPWLDWDTDGMTLDALRRRVAEERPPALGLTRVPNARLSAEVRALELLSDEENSYTASELRRIVNEHGAPGVDPEDLYALASELDYGLEISWARHGADGRFDVLLRAHDATHAIDATAAFPAPESRAGNWKEYANNPLRRALARELIPRLRAHLQERLPVYMVPSAFVMVDALPLNANGKVDRRALPAPDMLRPELGESYVAPRGAVEEQVADVWRQVLGAERVGVHDNFFELGGHSLIATQVVSRLCDAFDLELPLRQLFETPSVAGLAAAVVRRQAEQADDELLAQALGELEQLSEEEVQAMLEEGQLPPAGGEE
ncbi:MAG: amino acid adenylation domain-containing protein [Acidobacteria bacterium]|nr:amino acid adenylation domain-containing protein [Acidobacteriota bacterium]